jgi:hypothetical protein
MEKPTALVLGFLGTCTPISIYLVGWPGELLRRSDGTMTIVECVAVALVFATTCGAVLWAMKAQR